MKPWNCYRGQGIIITEQKSIAALRARLIALLVWDTCFRAITGWIFFYGAVVLIWRVLKLPFAHLATAGLGGMAVLCLLAFFYSRRRWPSIDKVAALMDARLAGGGLMMATEAGQADDWASEVSPNQLTPRWQGGIPGLIFLAALSFLILASWIPLSGKHTASMERPLEIEALVNELEARVELLKEIELIEEEQAKEWTTLMKALQQESSGLDPAATWEALDQLSERVEDAVAVEVMSRRYEVQKREELVAALKAALQAYEENSTLADAAMKELSDLLQQAALDNPNLKALLESLPEFGMQQIAASCLSVEEARLLAERMAQMTEDDLQRMQQMLQQGMCQSSDCQRPGGVDALKKFLAENPGCTNLMMCAGLAPGSGGVDRGPGTAPISWLGETSEEGVDFEEQILTASRLDSLANSEKVGESFGAPEVDAAAAGSTGGRLQGTTATDSAATTHSVLPQHRKAVDRFFKRDDGE